MKVFLWFKWYNSLPSKTKGISNIVRFCMQGLNQSISSSFMSPLSLKGWEQLINELCSLLTHNGLSLSQPWKADTATYFCMESMRLFVHWFRGQTWQNTLIQMCHLKSLLSSRWMIFENETGLSQSVLYWIHQSHTSQWQQGESLKVRDFITEGVTWHMVVQNVYIRFYLVWDIFFSLSNLTVFDMHSITCQTRCLHGHSVEEKLYLASSKQKCVYVIKHLIPKFLFHIHYRLYLYEINIKSCSVCDVG